MVAYCLPRSFVAKFIKESGNGGSIEPSKLYNMDSPTRRAALAKVLGDETHAKEVNALFEEKVLLPAYKYGVGDYLKRVTAPEATKKILADTIANLDPKILNPKNSKDFFEDLAEKTLGFQTTEAEAKRVFQDANNVKKTQADLEANILTKVTPKEHFQAVRGKPGVPTPQRDAAIARNNYGATVQKLNETMSDIAHQPNLVNSILSLTYAPKTLETGFLHLSAFGVQLWGSWTSPHVWSGFVEQIKYFADEENYKQLQSYIISHPDYKYAIDGKLGLTDIKGLTKFREEDVQSPLLQNVNTWLAEKTGLPINVFRASSRGFTGYLNYVRFNSFVDYLNALRNVDSDSVHLDSQSVRDAANAVNNLSGRANIGAADKYSGIVPLANTVVFTLRKTVADFKLAGTLATLNAPGYFSAIKAAADEGHGGFLYIEAIKNGNYAVANKLLLQSIGAVAISATTIGLIHKLHPFGITAEVNPLAQSFGEAETPSGQKINLAGPLRTLVRLGARLAYNKTINNAGQVEELGGKGPEATSAGQLILQEIRNKLGPLAGFFTDYFMGEDSVGRQFNLGVEARAKLEPIVIKNFIDYYMNNPSKALSDIPILSSAFGISVASPLPPGEKEGLTVWGENYNKYIVSDPGRDAVDEELKHLGIYEKFPPQTINGVKLTSQQYKAYIQLSGTDAKQRLQSVISSPNWANTSTFSKKMQVNMIISTSQQTAQMQLFAGSSGGDNDIIAKGIKAQNEKFLKSFEETK